MKRVRNSPSAFLQDNALVSDSREFPSRNLCQKWLDEHHSALSFHSNFPSRSEAATNMSSTLRSRHAREVVSKTLMETAGARVSSWARVSAISKKHGYFLLVEL